MIGLAMTFLHPFFISVIDINHNVKEGNIECSIKIFTDDFEANLAKNNKQLKVDFNNKNNKALNDKLIFEYIQKNLQLKINHLPKSFNYIGFEIQEESVWVYIETPQKELIKNMDVYCSLMYDFKEKQVDIIHVKANNAEKSYKLDNPKTSVSFNW